MRARKTVKKSRKTVQKSRKTVRQKKSEGALLNIQMRTTRVFQSGNSRAVRLPKDFELALGEVNICMRGDQIVVSKAPLTIGDIWKSAPKLPEGVKLERPKDDLPQKRNFKWD